ncbi:Ubiquinone biosynthesis monooxygenase COQ6 [Ooceraea biroi]|uniref:Ubiquinone biosynthesis monooxygenase COQ6 n=2 Tax=Ooceraea biroi TaxID=2015173 RepID=A0A026WIJ2_OOCBI|nr:Ubiquinone biosynthesis monooxygenase COQ6 [Ooceraea biroi]
MAALREAVLSHRLAFMSLSQNYKRIIPNVAAASRKNYLSTAEQEENYDIIITGGGMVGTTLACAIANNRRLEGKRVLLLEGSPKEEYTPQEKYSNRVVALNQQTRTLLSSFGAWKHIEAVRCCPVRKMQVWDACSEAMITFNENHLSDELAYIVENDLLLHAINKQLSEKENVTVIYESKVADVKLPGTSEGYATVQLHSGKRFRSRLLVSAE